MHKKRPKKQLSGSAKMAAKGKHPVLLWLTTSQHTLLKAAAAADQRPVTAFMIVSALKAANGLTPEAIFTEGSTPT